jgi:hypothetical protein
MPARSRRRGGPRLARVDPSVDRGGQARVRRAEEPDPGRAARPSEAFGEPDRGARPVSTGRSPRLPTRRPGTAPGTFSVPRMRSSAVPRVGGQELRPTADEEGPDAGAPNLWPDSAIRSTPRRSTRRSSRPGPGTHRRGRGPPGGTAAATCATGSTAPVSWLASITAATVVPGCRPRRP